MAQLIPQFKYDHKSLSLISNDISNNSQAEVNNTNSNNTNTNTSKETSVLSTDIYEISDFIENIRIWKSCYYKFTLSYS